MKNKNLSCLLFLMLLILNVLVACRKDKPLECNSGCDENNSCEDFPELWNSWFEEYRFQYKSPCFNPVNSSEFVYYYKDNVSNLFQLVKYDILSNQKSILISDIKIHGKLKWSSKGWIACTRKSEYVEHIFIFKNNGDSLTQITSSAANLNPFWNETGNELFWTHSPDLGSQWYLLRKNMNSSIVDTVSNMGGFHKVDVLNDKLLHISNIESGSFNGSPTYYGYHILSSPPFTYDNFNVIDNSKMSLTGGICWHPSGLHFYVTHSQSEYNGLYKVSTNGSIHPLIKHCDSKRYSTISCSSDGKKIVAERVDSFLEYDEVNNLTGKIIQKSSIWLIDTETLEQTKINLE